MAPARFVEKNQHIRFTGVASPPLRGKGSTPRCGSVLQAPTGHDACEILALQHPDVLLMDLMLPDMDGTEILRSLMIRRHASLKLILAVSGDFHDTRIVEVKALGANDLIPKPLNIQKQLTAVTTRMRQSHAKTPGSTRILESSIEKL